MDVRLAGGGIRKRLIVIMVATQATFCSNSASNPSAARTAEGHLSPEANPNPVPIRYRPGDTIPALAVYRVIHSPHRADHFAVLRAGDSFPRCHRCGDEVRFEITDIRTFVESDSLFHTTQVHEIPHPDTAKMPKLDDDEEGEGKVPAAG